MLVFVDYEHEERYAHRSGQKIQAARTWITYRLEDLSGLPCMLVRYNRITPQLLERLDAAAIFISGNGTDPDRYRSDELVTIHEIVRTTALPMFGFCGGFQLIAQALGATLVPLEFSPAQAEAAAAWDDEPRSGPIVRFPGGELAEFGYFPVAVTGAHPLLDGLGDQPIFRHAHGLHVPDPPAGFTVFASTEVTPVQLAVHDERRIVGAQFHPEYWTDEHRAGRTLIANFLHWAGIS